MMAEEGEELSMCSVKEVDHAGEDMNPTSPRMKRIMTMEPMKTREEEPHLKASVFIKGEGASVSLKAPEGVTEGSGREAKGSPKWVLRKNVPSDRSAYLINAGLLPEGADATFRGGIVSSEIPAGDPKVAALTAGEGMSGGSTVSHATFNADIKHQLMKEIRRFGRKYGKLFEILEDLQGPLEVRIQFVEFSIKEAARSGLLSTLGRKASFLQWAVVRAEKQ